MTTFLQSQPPAAASDLLATHLLRTSAFADAAAVLHQSVSAAAAAGADKAGGKAQGQSPAKQAAAEAAGAGSLGGYRRLLSVARLAARAGGAPQLEAAALLQLRLLGLQVRPQPLGRSQVSMPAQTPTQHMRRRCVQGCCCFAACLAIVCGHVHTRTRTHTHTHDHAAAS